MANHRYDFRKDTTNLSNFRMVRLVLTAAVAYALVDLLRQEGFAMSEHNAAVREAYRRGREGQ